MFVSQDFCLRKLGTYLVALPILEVAPHVHLLASEHIIYFCEFDQIPRTARSKRSFLSGVKSAIVLRKLGYDLPRQLLPVESQGIQASHDE